LNILVVGAGGTGSYAVPLLVKHLGPEDRLTIMDGDRFEKKNIDRQLFSKIYIGANKAEAMAKMYAPTSRAEIVAYPRFLECVPDELRRLQDDGSQAWPSAIISCPDNHPARLRCLEYADELGVPAVICGNELESASAMLYLPRFKGSPADPRVAYPDMLDGKDRDPTHACTGASQEAIVQLALANFMSAGMGVSLLFKAVIQPMEDPQNLPFELSWSVYGMDSSTCIRDVLTSEEK